MRANAMLSFFAAVGLKPLEWIQTILMAKQASPTSVRFSTRHSAKPTPGTNIIVRSKLGVVLHYGIASLESTRMPARFIKKLPVPFSQSDELHLLIQKRI